MALDSVDQQIADRLEQRADVSAFEAGAYLRGEYSLEAIGAEEVRGRPWLERSYWTNQSGGSSGYSGPTSWSRPYSNQDIREAREAAQAGAIPDSQVEQMVQSRYSSGSGGGSSSDSGSGGGSTSGGTPTYNGEPRSAYTYSGTATQLFNQWKRGDLSTGRFQSRTAPGDGTASLSLSSSSGGSGGNGDPTESPDPTPGRPRDTGLPPDMTLPDEDNGGVSTGVKVAIAGLVLGVVGWFT